MKIKPCIVFISQNASAISISAEFLLSFRVKIKGLFLEKNNVKAAQKEMTSLVYFYNGIRKKLFLLLPVKCISQGHSAFREM